MSFKSFKPKIKKEWEDPSSTPVAKKQNTYVAGFGFIPYDAKKEEEKYIKRRSNYLSLSGIVFLIMLASMNVLKPLIVEGLGHDFTGVLAQVYNVFTLFIALLFSSIIYMVLIEMPLKKVFPKGKMDIGMIFLGIGVFLFASTIGESVSKLAELAFFAFGVEVIPTRLFIPSSAFESIFFWVLLYIIPVILEEFFFQGIILQSLRPIGDGLAIITTTLISMFFIGDYTNFILVFLTSLILSYFSIRTNNILIPIIIRVFGNLIWGLQEQITSFDTQEALITKTIILILFLVVGAIAIIYLVYGREKMFELEEIETTIIYSSNIKKFYTTFLFLVMCGLMVGKMVFLK